MMWTSSGRLTASDVGSSYSFTRHRFFVLFGLVLWCSVSACKTVSAATPTGGCGDPKEIFNKAERLRSEWQRSALDQAIAKYEEAQRCSLEIGDSVQQADALKRIGDTYFILSDFA